MPTSRIAAISSVVATGRRMKGRDGFMKAAAGDGSRRRRVRGGRSALAPLATIARLARSGAGRRLGGPRLGGARQGSTRQGSARQGDLGALLQLVGAVDHD